MNSPHPEYGTTTATAGNIAGTVSVRTTEQGLPVEIRIDRRELRYGAQRLADEILELCRRSTLAAGARRREELAASGMPTAVLDRLGLPTHADLARARYDRDAEDPDATPASWLRPA